MNRFFIVFKILLQNSREPKSSREREAQGPWLESDAPTMSYSDSSVRRPFDLMRKRIETVFSQITKMMPHHIHAVSFRGFLLKVSLFIIAFALGKAFI